MIYSIVLGMSILLNVVLFMMDRLMSDNAIYKNAPDGYIHTTLFVWAQFNIIGTYYV